MTDNQEQGIAVDVVQEAPKMLSQDHVDNLVKEAKQKGYQKGLEAASSTPQSNIDVNSVENIVNDRLNQRLADLDKQQTATKERLHQEQLKAQWEQATQKVANELGQKMEAVKSEYPDYDSVIKKIDLGKMPEIAFAANTVENGGRVLYELGKNPGARAQFLTLTQRGDEEGAQDFINELSQQIKKRDILQNTKLPPDPSRQFKSSNSGIGSQPVTAADYRNYYKGKM